MRNYYALADKFPPLVCRLLARKPNGPPLTTLEIAERSGLTPHQVETISQGTTWAGVDILTMEKFLRGCGVDFCDRVKMQRVLAYIRVQVRLQKLNRSTYRYLRRSPDWKEIYEPMMRRLSQS